MKEELELSAKLDSDKGLAKSRKYLMFISLILLALVFSGATVTEANTFLFKLEFTNVGGIQNLLMLSIAFLLVRYYSNASNYHEAVYKDWTNRLLKNDSFYYVCEHSDVESGYLVDIAPDYVGFNDPSFAYDNNEHADWSFHINLLLNAQIQFDLHTQHGHVNNDRVYLFQPKHPLKSFKAFVLVFKTWLEAQSKHPESLEIYAPYFIAFLAVGLCIFQQSLGSF